MPKNIHIIPDDPSSTMLQEAMSSGMYQTIAGALLGSKEWKQWYKHNMKNPQFDVDETQECGWMSDGHLEAFIRFIKEGK